MGDPRAGLISCLGRLRRIKVRRGRWRKKGNPGWRWQGLSATIYSVLPPPCDTARQYVCLGSYFCDLPSVTIGSGVVHNRCFDEIVQPPTVALCPASATGAHQPVVYVCT